jgi:AcrR family transcriptional regulator
MGRKAGISIIDVTEAAATIADRDGLAATTLTAVANQLGIRTPSLYNHVNGLKGLHRLLALHAAGLLTTAFATASPAQGSDRLRAIARAYRTFATEHPGLYEALLPAPRPGEDDELSEAMAQPVDVVAEGLSETNPETAIHLIRALRSLLHGFVDLEANQGFGMPVDIDTSFDTAVELLIAGISDASSRADVR